MLFLIITIGDRYDGQISVPGGSNLRTFVLFSTLLHSNKDKKSLKALFLNFQTFLQGTHIEPVGTSSFKKDSSLESIFFDLGFLCSNTGKIPPRVP